MNESAALLHNFGAPPSVYMRWKGLAPSVSTSNAGEKPSPNGSGCWLYCRHRFQYSASVDWNRCTELLELIQPCHGLKEGAARQVLLESMEAHMTELDWPDMLVCDTGAYTGAVEWALDHPLTAFVALGKCIGSLWLRHQPWRLAPLASPVCIQGGGTGYGRGTHWGCRLWFPDGLTPHLLERIRHSSNKKGIV